MKIYLDIIMTTPDAEIEIIPQKDHQHCNYKHVIKKPKLSLWELYKIKKFLETGYEKLKEYDRDNKTTTKTEKSV